MLLQREGGFTALELLLVMTIMGLIMVSAGNVLITGWRSQVNMETEMRAKGAGRTILARLTRDLERTVRIETDLNESGRDFDQNYELYLGIGDGDGNTVAYHRYKLENNSLHYWEATGVDDWPETWGTGISPDRVFANRLLINDPEDSNSRQLFEYDPVRREVEINLELSRGPHKPDEVDPYLLQDKVVLRALN
jgi:prepilin-type N-terminal cleavage/methylation domain-containing protein